MAESTNKTKAGKKAGGYTPPPDLNPDKQAARYEGERQFQAKKFPAPVPSPQGSWEAALDTVCAAFGVKRIRRNQGHDTGIRFDDDRKRFITPPGREAKK